MRSEDLACRESDESAPLCSTSQPPHRHALVADALKLVPTHVHRFLANKYFIDPGLTLSLLRRLSLSIILAVTISTFFEDGMEK